MTKIMKNMKFQIIYCIIFAIIFYSVFLPLSCYCYEPVKTITITKEDILNAKPTPYPVEFNSKDLHIIEVMERRHFPKTYPELSDSERLKNLEYELLGRIWEYTPTQDRIKRLKIASSNTMIIGTALPASISTKRNVKRMRNDSIQLRQRDDVGLIDGFLRLLSPEKYEQYRRYSDKMFNMYEY